MEYSVVTTVYNDQNEIVQFLDEMCSQNKVPKEIVIADGGGTDLTRERIKEYAKSSSIPIKLFEGTRLNIAEGLNKAIREAYTDVVGIVAVGNCYPPHFFSTLCKVLEDNQQLDAVFSVIRGHNTTSFSETYNTVCANGQKLRCPSNHGTLMYKKCVEEIGYFYEDFYFAGEDEEFFGHFLEKGKKALCVDETWVTWETPKNWKEYYRQCELYRIGQMQMYSNTALLKMCWKYLIYVPGACVAVFFLIFERLRVCGASILLCYFLFNFFLIYKKGIYLCIFYNVSYFYKLIAMVRHGKYLHGKNKIDKCRRLNKAVQYG